MHNHKKPQECFKVPNLDSPHSLFPGSLIRFSDDPSEVSSASQTHGCNIDSFPKIPKKQAK